MLLMWLKSNFILWNVQNDNQVEQHKDMITSYQSEKHFQNKVKEKTNLLWPCVDDTNEFSFLLLFEVQYFSRFLFLFMYNLYPNTENFKFYVL